MLPNPGQWPVLLKKHSQLARNIGSGMVSRSLLGLFVSEGVDGDGGPAQFTRHSGAATTRIRPIARTVPWPVWMILADPELAVASIASHVHSSGLSFLP